MQNDPSTLLPEDMQAERMVLGSLLLERDAIVAVHGILSASDFYLERHAIIYQAILACYEQRTPPDYSTVASQLKAQGHYEDVGGLAYLVEIATEVPTATHVEHYAKNVVNAANLRAIIELGGHVAAAGYERNADAERILDMLQQRMQLVRRATARDAWHGHVQSAREIYRKQYEIVPFTVEQIIPPGSCLLVGKPKVRKSFTALNLAYAVASGGKAFGHFQAQRGDVLYIDLEMGEKRIYKRLKAYSPNTPPPPGIHFATTWPRVGEGGLEWLRSYLENNPMTRLVIIDTLVAVRPPRPRDLEGYEADKAFAQSITDFCQGYPELTVLCIHHARKMVGGDPVDDASGTTGLTGGMDNILSLERSTQEKNGGILKLMGRDIEYDDPLNLRWDNLTVQWVLVEGDINITPERRKILEILLQRPGLTATEIATITNRPLPGTRRLLSDMAKSHQIINAQGGYFHPEGDDLNLSA